MADRSPIGWVREVIPTQAIEAEGRPNPQGPDSPRIFSYRSVRDLGSKNSMPDSEEESDPVEEYYWSEDDEEESINET